jgi:hypothetical protein
MSIKTRFKHHISSTRICLSCKRRFTPTRSTQRFCCTRCRILDVYRRERVRYATDAVFRQHALDGCRTYYQNNTEKVFARVKKWQQANPDKVKGYISKSVKGNPEGNRRRARNFYYRHRDELLRKKKEQRQKISPILRLLESN